MTADKKSLVRQRTTNSDLAPERRREALAQICRDFGIDILYAFGSQARYLLAWVEGRQEALDLGAQASDIDIGGKPLPGQVLSVEEKVRLTMALEDLFWVPRVDLVYLPEADPFVAANVVRGERLYAQDAYRADEYDLYILRRAGDLAPLERERMALILGEKR